MYEFIDLLALSCDGVPTLALLGVIVSGVALVAPILADLIRPIWRGLPAPIKAAIGMLGFVALAIPVALVATAGAYRQWRWSRVLAEGPGSIEETTETAERAVEVVVGGAWLVSTPLHGELPAPLYLPPRGQFRPRGLDINPSLEGLRQ